MGLRISICGLSGDLQLSDLAVEWIGGFLPLGGPDERSRPALAFLERVRSMISFSSSSLNTAWSSGVTPTCPGHRFDAVIALAADLGFRFDRAMWSPVSAANWNVFLRLKWRTPGGSRYPARLQLQVERDGRPDLHQLLPRLVRPRLGSSWMPLVAP